MPKIVIDRRNAVLPRRRRVPLALPDDAQVGTELAGDLSHISETKVVLPLNEVGDWAAALIAPESPPGA